MNRLLLIDGNAIMHRAYHAMPQLTTTDGSPVQVVYGFASMIFGLYDKLKPSHMTVAFDRPGPTFRNELFTGYQAKRPKADDEFIAQIAGVHDLVAAFGIPTYEKDGYEADDVIGTIVKQVNSKQKTENSEKIDQVIIVTGDRDILQLVEDERVLVFMPTKGLSEGRVYGEKEVIERMGVTPSQVVDLKALMGDNSDNYLGVRGIGPKTAIRLLTEYGSIEKVYEELDNDRGFAGETTRKKLKEGKESALLGKKLAALYTHVPMLFDATSTKIDTLDTPQLRNMLETLQFRSLLQRLNRVNTFAKRAEQRKPGERSEKKSEQQQLF